jgi:hypothetical protein
MSIKEKYQLGFFIVSGSDGRREFMCDAFSPISYNIARKINQMHLPECEYLIEQIDLALAGKDYYHHILLDNTYADDNDCLEIHPPNVEVNRITEVPMDDMKLLISEWIEFVSTNSELHNDKLKRTH